MSSLGQGRAETCFLKTTFAAYIRKRKIVVYLAARF